MENINEALSQSDLNDILEKVALESHEVTNDMISDDILIIEAEDNTVEPLVIGDTSDHDETDSGESQDTEEEEKEKKETEEEEYVDVKDLGNLVALPEKTEEDTVCTILIGIWVLLFLLFVLGYIIFFYPTYTSKCCFSFHNISFCKFSDHCEKYLRALNYNLPETALRLCCYHITPYNTSNATVLCLHSCLEEGRLNLY